MTENALIINADLYFQEIGGSNGLNFVLSLMLKTITGQVGVKFNPMRLPQLLETLKLEKFSELKGTYVQITDTPLGEEVKGIRHIMARDDSDWFNTENSIYFGSKFFKGYEK